MKFVLKMLIWIIAILGSIYLILLVGLYFFQEKLLFVPDVLPQDYVFKFDASFEEKNVETTDHKILNGLLFKSDSAKGIVFFLHGNAGANNSWGFVGNVYNELNYDFYVLDYRGYGKSQGRIKSEAQLYDDVQLAYNMIAKEYGEDKIIIIGQSLGTGPAAMLAARNKPQKLVLITPYYSLSYIVDQKFRIVPNFLLKYKFRTDEFVKEVEAPIYIFHGNKDNLINYNSSLMLIKLCKASDKLIILENQVHNGIHDNADFLEEMDEILQ